jgi:glycosyltransferase involved in cell wall biosynthesis
LEFSANSFRRPRDFVVLGAIDWQPLWQQAQEVAARCARAGGRVVYVENTGVRGPGLHDLGRIGNRLRNGIAKGVSTGVHEVEPGLHVITPLVLPPLGVGPARTVNRHILLRRVQRAIAALGLRDPVLITYLPTDTALDLIGRLRTSRGQVIYCCTADFARLARHPSRLRASEERLLEQCDVVLAMHPSLAEHCARIATRVHPFPPAVDLNAFTPTVWAARPPGKGAVIGYVGGIHRYLDLDLLAAIARARPAWRLVCVGPIQRSSAPVDDLTNVTLLGARPHAELPAIISGFDVCLIPYVLNATTATVWPTKLFEYLAMGKPVVSTALPAAVTMHRRNARSVAIAPGAADTFTAAIEAALEDSDDDGAAERRRIAVTEGSWDARMATLYSLIEPG